jgi:hypothetical protein
MIYCIDVDGTICTTTENEGGYTNARPDSVMVKKINDLYDNGHIIKIHTARGQVSGIDQEAFTIQQLKDWGVKFHEFYYGKPAADLYIDDKAMTPKDFINRVKVEKCQKK